MFELVQIHPKLEFFQEHIVMPVAFGIGMSPPSGQAHPDFPGFHASLFPESVRKGKLV